MNLFDYNTKYFYYIDCTTINIYKYSKYRYDYVYNEDRKNGINKEIEVFEIIEDFLNLNNINYFINYSGIFYYLRSSDSKFKSVNLCTDCLIPYKVLDSINNKYYEIHNNYYYLLRYMGKSNLIVDRFAVNEQIEKCKKYILELNYKKILILCPFYMNTNTSILPLEIIYKILSYSSSGINLKNIQNQQYDGLKIKTTSDNYYYKEYRNGTYMTLSLISNREIIEQEINHTFRVYYQSEDIIRNPPIYFLKLPDGSQRKK